MSVSVKLGSIVIVVLYFILIFFITTLQNQFSKGGWRIKVIYTWVETGNVHKKNPRKGAWFTEIIPELCKLKFITV